MSKKKYILIERQGGGCDYTIGCGIRTTTLSASSLEEAVKEILEHTNLVSHYQGGYEYCPDKAELLEVTRTIDLDGPLTSVQNKLAEIRAEKDAAEQEAEEKAELKRLQEKYGQEK